MWVDPIEVMYVGELVSGAPLDTILSGRTAENKHDSCHGNHELQLLRKYKSAVSSHLHDLRVRSNGIRYTHHLK